MAQEPSVPGESPGPSQTCSGKRSQGPLCAVASFGNLRGAAGLEPLDEVHFCPSPRSVLRDGWNYKEPLAAQEEGRKGSAGEGWTVWKLQLGQGWGDPRVPVVLTALNPMYFNNSFYSFGGGRVTIKFPARNSTNLQHR